MFQEFITYLDSVVYGVGLPGVVMVVVTVTTVVTTLRLRKAAAWRSESSSGTLSSREVALTKMLIGSSILFIVCVSPISLFKSVMEICTHFPNSCVMFYFLLASTSKAYTHTGTQTHRGTQRAVVVVEINKVKCRFRRILAKYIESFKYTYEPRVITY